MPNTLAHLGVGGAITRALIADADAKWVYLGCAIPDIPWIFQRVTSSLPLEVDPYDLRLYVIVQASLAGCLILSGGMALMSAAPRKVFFILALNSIVHLLLDACQTKWGNGVNLFAPFSWEGQNFGFFWPESVTSYVLTVLGLVYVALDWFYGPAPSIGFSLSSPRRAVASVALVVTFFLMPVVLREPAYRSNVHFVETLVEKNSRAGRAVEFDRGRYVHDEQGGVLVSFAGEHLGVTGRTPDRTVRVSVRGRFIDENTVLAQQMHEHLAIVRDAASIIGLALIGLFWIVPLARNQFNNSSRFSPRRWATFFGGSSLLRMHHASKNRRAQQGKRCVQKRLKSSRNN